MQSFDISVIVCTKNRKEKLFETIDRLVEQKTNNDFTYEILIIDSSDESSTKARLSERYQNFDIRYHMEPDLNLSEARNFGINSARGKIVAFIDDDGIAEDFWILEHYKLYSDPSVVSVGGKIVPIWLSEIPGWLSPEILESYGGYLSLLDLGSQVKQIRYPEIPYGCNMSFRKDIFLGEMEFDKRLGRSGNTLMSNEEAYLYYILNQKGYKIMYTPFAIVHHQIDPSRLTKSFFDRRSYWDGASNARMDEMTRNKNQRIIKFLKFLVVKMPKNMFGYILYSWVLKRTYESFVHKSRISYFFGYIIEEIKSL